MPDLWLVVLCILLAGVVFVLLRPKRHHLPVYIGDQEHISKIMGSIEMKRAPWEVFDGLAKKYGPICSFHVGRQPVVVLSSSQLAGDLLEKRGDIYSSRPRLIMANDILGGGLRGVTSPYGDYWRRWRKLQHAGMSARATLAYREHQTLESTVLLRDLLRHPNGYRDIIQRFSASIVISISYGRRASSLEDTVVKANVASIEAYLRAAAPGKFLVDAWPILLKLPRRLQWFRHAADRKHAKETKYNLQLLQDVQKRMDAGINKECMASRTLEALAEGEYEGVNKVELAFGVAAPFAAGVDTTAGSIEYALVAIMCYPSVARKVRAELDEVIGRSRLPTFEDEPVLPYLQNFLRELVRWRPVVPLAVPHSVTQDDIVLGACIPKGATVYGNIYTMMQDPNMFPNPSQFLPERFDDKALQNMVLPFGFGRRSCPGAHVALQSLFIVVARLLWTFDVVGPNPDPNAHVNHGLVRTPAPFKFTLRARDDNALKCLETEVAHADRKLLEWE
ncbi:cytochrome P450 [Rhodocollybia butyracea]|uniref:Cytochrome P450 n=1 Tax=Rhodocollybia butyracea TaxID=206335 RepID=A0A9P5P8Q7_9AGAR|nr:cytochrome P450 [Rhodocollybia butyracea]